MTLADLPEMLEDRALLAVVEGPGEALGVLALAPALVAGLIEAQTTGRPGSGPVLPRRPTRTDAAMCAGFVDAALAGFGAQLAAAPDRAWAEGFRYASFLDDPRPLGLLLEETSYRVLRLGLELGEGAARAGALVLALPAEGRGPGPEPPAPGAGVEAAAARAWSERMERGVLASPVRIDAVLHRTSLPIAAVLALRPGSVIPVPLAALERLRLEGLDGCAVALGRLGQHRGHRALRIVEDGDPPLLPGDLAGGPEVETSCGPPEKAEAGGM